jgi:hypothetical protein
MSSKRQLDRARVLMAWISGVSAAFSIFFAYKFRTDWYAAKVPWGYVMIGIWAIAPPVWFFLEYAWWPPAQGHEDERARHFHDLARNIWLALIVILAVLMGVPWPGSGG